MEIKKIENLDHKIKDTSYYTDVVNLSHIVDPVFQLGTYKIEFLDPDISEDLETIEVYKSDRKFWMKDDDLESIVILEEEFLEALENYCLIDRSKCCYQWIKFSDGLITKDQAKKSADYVWRLFTDSQLNSVGISIPKELRAKELSSNDFWVLKNFKMSHLGTPKDKKLGIGVYYLASQSARVTEVDIVKYLEYMANQMKL